jgi:hypothetical protein
MVQHDLLRMISLLLGDQPHDAYMEEAISEAAAPQSPGPASPLPAPAPCPVLGYVPCPPHEMCPMNLDFDAAARTPTPPPPRTPPPTMAACMSAPSRLMAYASVDPMPAAPPPSLASPERTNDVVAPPPRIIHTWISVPHGPSAHWLANEESAGSLPSTEGSSSLSITWH